MSQEDQTLKKWEELYDKRRAKERRDLFAAAALQGMIASGNNYYTIYNIPSIAAELADALIAELALDDTQGGEENDKLRN